MKYYSKWLKICIIRFIIGRCFTQIPVLVNDIVIFGATGCTGEYVVKEFVKFGHKKYSWAISGRNKAKLEELLIDTTNQTSEDVTSIPIILADCGNEGSLNEMAKKAKIVINCCGPYRFYDEIVVKACIENGSHHVDVSGELEYMENMQVKYSDEATKKRVYIISACGLNSVPNDLGVIYFVKNFNGTVNSIESYMELGTTEINDSICNYTTWESAVHELAHVEDRKPIREKLFPKDELLSLKPRLKRRPLVHLSQIADNKFCVPFPVADASVVRRTQYLLYSLQKQRPVQFHMFLVCNNFIMLVALAIIGLFIGILNKFSFVTKLLLNYPQIFTFGMVSHKKPSVEAFDVAVLKFHGEGWSSDSVADVEDKMAIALPTNKTMDMKMSFCSPGYGFTSMAVILSAITVLEEQNKLPSIGGVYTPGAAFYETTFLSKLQENGLSIELM